MDLSLFESMIRLDMFEGSPYSRALFNMFAGISNDNLKSKYKALIYYKWARVYTFALIYSVLFWTQLVLTYIHLGYFPEQVWMGVVIIVFSATFVLFELKCMVSDTLYYIKDFWNYIDLFIQIFTVISCAIITGKESDNMTVGLNWMRLVCVVILGVRAITWLRVFRPTRYLITMVV